MKLDDTKSSRIFFDFTTFRNVQRGIGIPETTHRQM